MPSYHSQDIGAVLDVVSGITPDNWDGAADIDGASFDRHDYNNPHSAKFIAELGDTTALDEVEFEVQESDDDATWGVIGTLTPTHASKFASLDVDLSSYGRYIRVVADASDSTVDSNLDLTCQVVLGGAKVNG